MYCFSITNDEYYKTIELELVAGYPVLDVDQMVGYIKQLPLYNFAMKTIDKTTYIQIMCSHHEGAVVNDIIYDSGLHDEDYSDTMHYADEDMIIHECRVTVECNFVHDLYMYNIVLEKP